MSATTFWSRLDYYAHFTGGEIEAWRADISHRGKDSTCLCWDPGSGCLPLKSVCLTLAHAARWISRTTDVLIIYIIVRRKWEMARPFLPRHSHGSGPDLWSPQIQPGFSHRSSRCLKQKRGKMLLSDKEEEQRQPTEVSSHWQQFCNCFFSFSPIIQNN